MTDVRSTTATKFQVNDVVKFIKDDDPLTGVHAVVTAVNPLPAPFFSEEHYRIFVPGLEETYAFGSELIAKEVV